MPIPSPATAELAHQEALTRQNAPRQELLEHISPALPLVTLCWRALQRGAADRERGRREAAEGIAQLERLVGDIAVELYGVKRILEDSRWGETTDWTVEARKGLDLALARIERLFSAADVEVSAPVGATYTGELLETLRNAAQLPVAGIELPIVREILSPSVLVKGRLVRPGVAVIAVPIPTDASPNPNPSASPSDGIVRTPLLEE